MVSKRGVSSTIPMAWRITSSQKQADRHGQHISPTKAASRDTGEANQTLTLLLRSGQNLTHPRIPISTIFFSSRIRELLTPSIFVSLFKFSVSSSRPNWATHSPALLNFLRSHSRNLTSVFQSSISPIRRHPPDWEGDWSGPELVR
jgi:hypothetical protein